VRKVTFVLLVINCHSQTAKQTPVGYLIKERDTFLDVAAVNLVIIMKVTLKNLIKSICTRLSWKYDT
jgi:hypothetical protein